MKWNWDPNHWKRSTKVLLGLATIWPFIYIGLFFLVIVSFTLLIPFAQERSAPSCGDLDLIQLTHKIKNGELKQLTIRGNEVLARDRAGDCEYKTHVTNESTRAELLREAKEVDASGSPRVARIEEESEAVSPALPIGFAALFIAHMVTIVLTLALMPLYLVLAVKSDRLDETTRIIWVILICTVGLFAMPVYWYLNVWRKPATVHPVTAT